MTRINMNGTGRVVIDGKTFSGRNVTISNGKVTVDGVVQDGELVGDVNITVSGDVEKIENSCGKVVANNVGSVITQSGDVECGHVDGSISTMSGDVKCKSVRGSISTMSGDVDKRL